MKQQETLLLKTDSREVKMQRNSSGIILFTFLKVYISGDDNVAVC